MKVELVSLTQPLVDGIDTAEELIAYCARVSNPSNQMNTETAPNLIRYLIKNKHWSPFEMASMCVSIETSRAIAAQILRHRSFSFQEFSQRYSEIYQYEWPELRLKAENNRQSSSEVFNKPEINSRIADLFDDSFQLYEDLIDAGVATETARMILPLSTKTKIYMNGTLRSWIHYIEIRADEHTQKEHRQIAIQVKNIVQEHFPNIYEAIYGV